MTDGTPADRLLDLLLAQARAPGVPDWIVTVLEGREEAEAYETEGASLLRVERSDGQTFEVRVQLVPPMTPPVLVGPWIPGEPVPDAEVESLSYVVVDEIVDKTADLAVTSWPQLDDRGRLRFPDEEPVTVRALAEDLRAYLSEPETGERRTARMGDVLAARVDRERLEALAREDDVAEDPPSPSAWLVPPVYDVGEAARVKAKEAFYAAVTPTLSEGQADAMLSVDIREPPPA
jgi:hypothetical protein